MSKLIIFDLDGVLVGGLKIKTFDVPKMWGIGTPEDLNYFLENYK
jgi:hypothetical protein